MSIAYLGPVPNTCDELMIVLHSSSLCVFPDYPLLWTNVSTFGVWIENGIGVWNLME